MPQFTANIGALDVVLDGEQIAVLDAVSAPTLGFPHENNSTYAAITQYAGATVDDHEHRVSPALLASTVRY